MANSCNTCKNWNNRPMGAIMNDLNNVVRTARSTSPGYCTSNAPVSGPNLPRWPITDGQTDSCGAWSAKPNS